MLSQEYNVVRVGAYKMQGFSGTYAANGVDFILPPSTARWEDRDTLGIDGNAHPVYSLYRNFEMRWELAHPNDVKQLIDIYNTLGNTGTAVFDLPQWGAANFLYYGYSGCTMIEPTVGEYFMGWLKDVTLVVTKVRV